MRANIDKRETTYACSLLLHLSPNFSRWKTEPLLQELLVARVVPVVVVVVLVFVFVQGEKNTYALFCATASVSGTNEASRPSVITDDVPAVVLLVRQLKFGADKRATYHTAAS